jgi:hypothetical protein
MVFLVIATASDGRVGITSLREQSTSHRPFSVIRRTPFRVSLKRSGVAILGAFGLLFLIVTLTPVNMWWARILEGQGYEENGDVLVVLSGSMELDGSMGWSSFREGPLERPALRYPLPWVNI